MRISSLRISSLRLLILVIPLSLLVLAPPAWSGDIQGTITYDDKLPKLRPIDMSADPKCSAKHDGPVPPGVLVVGENRGLGNVFVRVVNAPASARRSSQTPVIIDQVGCMYQPRVVGALVGQPVIFKNSDGIFHNVHGLPKKNDEFNVAMVPGMADRPMKFDTPELALPVKCDVHPWMNAYVAVMTHPYFGVTEANGHFEIKGLPAGNYKIEAWHERLGKQTVEVAVAAKGSADVSMAFKVPRK